MLNNTEDTHIEMLEKLNRNYGKNFPYKAKYIRDCNRIYAPEEFKDGEELKFFCASNKPSTCVNGLAYYINSNGIITLVGIEELARLD